MEANTVTPTKPADGKCEVCKHRAAEGWTGATDASPALWRCGICAASTAGEWHPDTQTIVTGDGVQVAEGDRVFSHYSMRAGVIRGSFGFDGWFDLVYDDGSRDYLNGERICSLGHAKRMGWLKPTVDTDTIQRAAEPTLAAKLDDIADQIRALEDAARELVENAPHEPVTLEGVREYTGRLERYVVVRPDGRPYRDVPGISERQINHTQRPAALRAAQRLPGARLYDTKTRTVVWAPGDPS